MKAAGEAGESRLRHVPWSRTSVRRVRPAAKAVVRSVSERRPAGKNTTNARSSDQELFGRDASEYPNRQEAPSDRSAPTPPVRRGQTFRRPRPACRGGVQATRRTTRSSSSRRGAGAERTDRSEAEGGESSPCPLGLAERRGPARRSRAATPRKARGQGVATASPPHPMSAPEATSVSTSGVLGRTCGGHVSDGVGGHPVQPCVKRRTDGTLQKTPHE